MKKRLLMLSATMLTVVLATTVQADVIFTPEDKFYESHYEECDYVDGHYIAAGAEGETTVYQSPDYTAEVAYIPNGECFYIGFAWEDWLCSDMGWIHSDDVVRQYDSKDFRNDHQVQDHQDDGYSTPLVQMYTYPNSGDCYEMEEDANYATIGDCITQSYIDKNGLQWGYIGYYMQREGWICMDDPTNGALNGGVVPQGESLSQQRGSDAVVESRPNPLWIATGLVAAVVGVTGVLLLRKKKS